MNNFIEALVERNYQNKIVGFIENGTWAPMAAKVIKDKLANQKNMTFVEPVVKILSSVNKENLEQIKNLAANL